MPSEFCVCSSCIQLESILHSFPSPTYLGSPPPPRRPSAACFSSVPRRLCRPSFGQPSFTLPTAGINSFRYYFARQALTFSIRLIKLFFSSAVPISAARSLPSSSRRDAWICETARARATHYIAAIDYGAFNAPAELRRHSKRTQLNVRLFARAKNSGFPDIAHSQTIV